MTAHIAQAVFAQVAEATKGAAPAAKKTGTKEKKGAQAKTEAKPATKPAPVKTETKGATKGTATKKGAAANVISFGIHDGSRPAAGRLLFSFTHAWLSASGLAAGGSIPRAMAQKIAGSTAVSYHLGNKNLTEDKDGHISLTSKGQEAFSRRAKMGQVDAKMVEAYIEALKTGKPQDGIIPRAADCFVKL